MEARTCPWTSDRIPAEPLDSYCSISDSKNLPLLLGVSHDDVVVCPTASSSVEALVTSIYRSEEDNDTTSENDGWCGKALS